MDWHPLSTRKNLTSCPGSVDHYTQYKKRNVTERLFRWLKEKRRICTRYDKLASSFKAMITLVYIERCLRADISDKP
ncbi:transposase [Pseudomonas tremae]|uniref:transposase n=1 Tax=Pseudomonas tremae TaxID=200454 RepID=UPI003D161CF4